MFGSEDISTDGSKTVMDMRRVSDMSMAIR